METKEEKFKDAFEKNFDKIMNECRTILFAKNKEYSIETGNRFEQFDNASKEFDITVYQVWAVMFSKGLNAIKLFCKNTKTHSTETIQHRILDAINYLIILYNIVDRENNKNEHK